MAEVWCDKMLECSQDKSLGVKECRKTLFDNFKNGFDALPKERKFDLPRPTYDECRQNIQKSSCEELKQAQSLPACEFISLLGQ